MREQHTASHRGPRTSHASFPAQLLLGLLFMAAGLMLLAKKIGADFVPYVPEILLVYVCAIGGIVGGLYLIIHKIYRPRLYL